MARWHWGRESADSTWGIDERMTRDPALATLIRLGLPDDLAHCLPIPASSPAANAWTWANSLDTLRPSRS